MLAGLPLRARVRGLGTYSRELIASARRVSADWARVFAWKGDGKMTEAELIERCELGAIQWAKGERDGVPGFWLHWPNPHDPGDKECSFVRLDVLAGLSWSEVRRFVVNGRNVYGVSRVVGYFSRITNWNKSKVGELKDRQRGNYSLTGSTIEAKDV